MGVTPCHNRACLSWIVCLFDWMKLTCRKRQYHCCHLYDCMLLPWLIGWSTFCLSTSLPGNDERMALTLAIVMTLNGSPVDCGRLLNWVRRLLVLTGLHIGHEVSVSILKHLIVKEPHQRLVSRFGVTVVLEPLLICYDRQRCLQKYIVTFSGNSLMF